MSANSTTATEQPRYHNSAVNSNETDGVNYDVEDVVTHGNELSGIFENQDVSLNSELGANPTAFDINTRISDKYRKLISGAGFFKDSNHGSDSKSSSKCNMVATAHSSGTGGGGGGGTFNMFVGGDININRNYTGDLVNSNSVNYISNGTGNGILGLSSVLDALTGGNETDHQHPSTSNSNNNNSLVLNPSPTHCSSNSCAASVLHTCTFCPKSFQSRADVVRHLRTHTGERPYKCPHCDYCAALKGNLKSHIYSRHSPEKVAKYITQYH